LKQGNLVFPVRYQRSKAPPTRAFGILSRSASVTGFRRSHDFLRFARDRGPHEAAVAAYLRCRERLFTAATNSAGSTGLLMCV
jgi:hypothetical protein